MKRQFFYFLDDVQHSRITFRGSLFPRKINPKETHCKGKASGITLLPHVYKRYSVVTEAIEDLGSWYGYIGPFVTCLYIRLCILTRLPVVGRRNKRTNIYSFLANSRIIRRIRLENSLFIRSLDLSIRIQILLRNFNRLPKVSMFN